MQANHQERLQLKFQIIGNKLYIYKSKKANLEEHDMEVECKNYEERGLFSDISSNSLWRKVQPVSKIERRR